MPTEYEIVTHAMNHTTTRKVALEMGPETFANQYLRRHRDEVPLQVDDWNGFRDPDEITYRKYNRMQDEAESFVDRVLEEYAGRRQADLDHSPRWLEGLGVLLTPQRFPVHGLQMTAAYLAQIGPSSYISNAASFQSADELRRVQRLAYRTKQLQLAHPDRGFGEKDRERWERDAGWQGAREAIERTFAVRDWDAAFVALNLVVKPAFDAIFLFGLAALARQHGDEVDALLLENLAEDSERSGRWSAALARFAIARRSENRDVLRRHVDTWHPLADRLVASGSALLGGLATRDDFAGVTAQAARSRLERLAHDAGLS
jgi:toluene monooxygenase system protein E